MSAKMQRLYQKFLTEMIADDLLTGYINRSMSTATALVWKENAGDPDGTEMVADISAVSAGHPAGAQTSREIVLMLGGRRNDLKTTVIRMSVSDYNTKIHNRYKNAYPSSDARALMWRNYIVENNLLPAVRKCRDFHPSHRTHSEYSKI